MLRRKTLTIRRDDHLDDVIGAAFFESDANAGTTIADCIRNYLGRRITLVRAEVGSRDALVTVEARGFTVESERMLEEAAILWRGGARRSAIATAQQAIDLDPLNADAHVSMGEYLIDHKKPGPALQALKRATIVGTVAKPMSLAAASLAWPARTVPASSIRMGTGPSGESRVTMKTTSWRQSTSSDQRPQRMKR